jgi:hypothetical protein
MKLFTTQFAPCRLTSLLCYQPKAGLEMRKPQILNTDDMLMCTPQGAMIDEYGATMESWLAAKTEDARREPCFSASSSTLHRI